MKEIVKKINSIERCLEVSEAPLDFCLHFLQIADHFIDRLR